MSTGTSEHVFGQCLKKAADCRRRAIQTRNDSLHDVLLRMELCRLRLGEQLNDGAAIVAASDASFGCGRKRRRPVFTRNLGCHPTSSRHHPLGTDRALSASRFCADSVRSSRARTASQMLDCLIVGGGPAGLTAAIYLARYRRVAVLVDEGASRAALIPASPQLSGFQGHRRA